MLGAAMRVEALVFRRTQPMYVMLLSMIIQFGHVDHTVSAPVVFQNDQQPELLKRLQSEDAAERQVALKELAELKGNSGFALPTLRKMLDEPVTEETILVVLCLKRIGPAAADTVPRLHAMLKCELPSQKNDVNNVPEFDEMFGNKIPPVSALRFAAASAMSRMGPAGEVAIPTLIKMLTVHVPSVKTYLKPRKGFAPSADGYAALGYRSDEHGSYKDQRDWYLVLVVSLLGEFGKAAYAAVPAIEAVRDDPELAPIVKLAALDVLKKIQKTETLLITPQQ